MPQTHSLCRCLHLLRLWFHRKSKLQVLALNLPTHHAVDVETQMLNMQKHVLIETHAETHFDCSNAVSAKTNFLQGNALCFLWKTGGHSTGLQLPLKISTVAAILSISLLNMWCDASHICFHSKHLPPMLDSGFEL